MNTGLQEVLQNIVSGDGSVQGAALVDSSGLLLASKARAGGQGLEKAEQWSSLSATAAALAPEREPGVVTVVTDQRTVHIRKGHGHTLIVARDPAKDTPE